MLTDLIDLCRPSDDCALHMDRNLFAELENVSVNPAVGPILQNFLCCCECQLMPKNHLVNFMHLVSLYLNKFVLLKWCKLNEVSASNTFYPGL